MVFIFKKAIASLMILTLLVSLFTPTVSAQTQSTNYSKEEIISESLEIKPDGTYLFDTEKATSMGMSKEDAIEAKQSFVSLGTYVKNNSELPKIETKSKASIAIKGAIDYMKAHKTKVNNVMHSAIDKIPFVKEKVKENWKELFTVGAIADAMSHYIGFAASVEEAISGAITDVTPIPGYAADIIAKTITLVLPI